MVFIRLQQLNRAHRQVQAELQSLGLWSGRLERIDVLLVPFSWACYGWQNYRQDGSICIPALSGVRASDWISRRSGLGLRDVLRHEWAHALADQHRELVADKAFIRAFGADHEDEEPFEYDPQIHVSEYAATNASEDFAENFRLFVKHRGRLSARHRTASIQRRWKFIQGLRQRLR